MVSPAPGPYNRSDVSADSNYSDEEVEAIFRRALERQVEEEDGYGHDELVAAAREVGLDEASVERAVAEVAAERGTEAVRAKLKKKSRERWLRHFVTYVVVVGGLLGLHALGFMGAAAVWIAFLWGMGLALHTFGTVRGPSEERIAKEQRRLNRRARRRARARARADEKLRREEERRRRQAEGKSGDELERVIEEGVTLLLNAAARGIAEAGRKMNEEQRRKQRGPRTEFERYVHAKKTGQEAVVTPPPKAQPRVRVEVEEELGSVEAELEALKRRRQRR